MTFILKTEESTRLHELFEQQAINNNKTYEFITSIQEIKLQDCEHVDEMGMGGYAS